MENWFVGIEIGGTKIQVVSSNAVPRIVERYRTVVDTTQGAQGILDAIDEGFRTLLKGRTPAAVGIGFGGPVHWDSLKIGCSHHVEGWDGFPLGDWVRDRTRAHVALENDANVACLAEASVGAGQSSNPTFYTTLGSGVGGGLVIDGDIYHGALPGESEIGHIRLNKSGLILEDACSGWAVDRQVKAAIEADPHGVLAKNVALVEGPPAAGLGPALVAGDPSAQRIVSQTADDLAFGLSHVIHLQHPETIIIGGGLSLLGEPLRAAVAAALPQYVMKILHPVPQVKLAALGEDVVPVGALVLAERTFLKAK